MGSCHPSKQQRLSWAQLVVSVKTITAAAFRGSSPRAIVQEVFLVKAQCGLVSARWPGS